MVLHYTYSTFYTIDSKGRISFIEHGTKKFQTMNYPNYELSKLPKL